MVHLNADAHNNSPNSRVDGRRLMPNSLVVLSTNSVVPTSIHVVRSGSLFIDRSDLANRSSSVRGFPGLSRTHGRANDVISLSGVYFVKSGIIDKSTGNVIFTANDRACLKAVTGGITNRHTTATFSGKVAGIDLLLVHFVLVVIPVMFLIGKVAGNS